MVELKFKNLNENQSQNEPRKRELDQKISETLRGITS